MDARSRQPWNQGKLIGQKAPLTLRNIWAIRIQLQLRHETCDVALFNLALDSKLRACDLMKLRVLDVAHGGLIALRAMVIQQKTKRPVQFEITTLTRQSLKDWMTLHLCGRMLACFRAAPVRHHIFPLGSTHGLCIIGSLKSARMVREASTFFRAIQR